MSHLGDRLSALVDGELSHGERDRLHAHLAECAQCRSEAKALRVLKRRVAALGEAAMDPRLLTRLFTLAEPGEPVRERPRAFPGSRRPRPALLVYPDNSHVAGGRRRGWRRGTARATGMPSRPRVAGAPARRTDGPPKQLAGGRMARISGRGRVPYAVAGVAALLVTVGGLSFFAGGTQGTPGPRVTPSVEMFTVEHSVTTGEVPFANPTAAFMRTRAPGRGGP